MSVYGAPPSSGEIEVMLFGPGYGEAIAIHLGDGVWLLVDSCIDPCSKEPATGKYLDEIGIQPGQVHSIIASHWHDDHVRGISQLAEKYPDANFVFSGIFNSQEAAAFLAAYSGSVSPNLSRGTNELYMSILGRQNAFPALHRTNVLEETLNAKHVRVTALSPLPTVHAKFTSFVAQYMAQKDRPINHAPEIGPNIAAVALHIDLGDDAVLLGADLEENSNLGWSAVVADQWSGVRRPATAYKVAHHGSKTGDYSRIWTTLLMSNPIACLTPFTRGKCRLPTDVDRGRIKEHTPHAYISSGASRQPAMNRDQLKRLADICNSIALVDAGFGAVRLRKQIGASSWKVEMFGNAQAL